LLLGCALIAIRRASMPEGRVLALILVLVAVPPVSIVVPDSAATAFSLTAAYVCGLVASLLLVVLSSRFGVQTLWRRALESCAYGALGLNAAAVIVFSYGLFTLRIDPLRYGLGNLTVGLTAALSVGLGASVAVVAVAAVASTLRSERPRAAWLLLPLPVALLVANGIDGLVPFARTWGALEVIYLLSASALLLGAMTVTYALLNRRVLDFGFVLSRTLVVSIIGLAVVIAFVLLEWVLGSVLTGVSHATGLIANAVLALIIGVSLSYIHKRADQFVDAVLFRKRHENERALLEFSKEVAYVTELDALLDTTLDKIRRHTDARSATLLLDGSGSYTAVRSYGDGTVVSLSENDEAILALKTWHKPIDPHHYHTALHGALALPTLARGRLCGVLLLGERAGGEAYAPDEVEALSQFAHGVGSALEALSLRTNGAATLLGERVELAIATMGEMIAEIRTLRTSLPT
jgi:GAF domain